MLEEPSNVPDARKPLLIENVYEKETSDSFVERHFRDRKLHRCRHTDEFDVAALATDFMGDLVRSAQDLEPNRKGMGLAPHWTVLIFQRPGNVFWHFVVKSNTYGPKSDVQEYTLTVTATDAAVAAAEAVFLHKKYTVNDDSPGFFLVQDVKKPRRIALKPEYFLSPDMLDLHYGEGFANWSEQFCGGLNQSGLSILRGAPGTGKTSYLRHLIYNLSETHRFYYIPVDAFGLLQSQIVDFLAKEKARFAAHILVLVLEDAEQLLLDRKGHRDGLASSLLNFSDGFVGDIVQAHLICTINGQIKDLDDAVLRPGRQRFFREFAPLSPERAAALANALGVSLKETRSYTLAELYHMKDLQTAALAAKPESKRIGFL